MSHFSVIVETKEPPTEDVIGLIMQPWHEFECTGIDDQYVQEIDKTAEAIEGYKSATKSMVRVDGVLVSAWDDRFYRKPTADELAKIGPIAGSGAGNGMSWQSKDWGDGLGYRTMVRDAANAEDIPASEVQPFSEWAKDNYSGDFLVVGEPRTEKHKYGFIEVDENGSVLRIIRRTNPNKMWDYWRIGGRSRGKLWPKDGPNIAGKMAWEFKFEAEKGREPPAGSDVCQRKNLDFDHMKKLRMADREMWIDEIMERTKLTRLALEVAIIDHWAYHAKWLTLAEPRPRGAEYIAWATSQGCVYAKQLGLHDIPEIGSHKTIDAWIAAAPALTTFAFVDIDGKWNSKGKMGWWGCVSDERDDSEWQNAVDKYVREMNPEHWLCVLDCHI